MDSVNFIPSWNCQDFARNVYSPLCLCYVDREVDKLFSVEGLTFSTFLSAVSAKTEPRMRIIDLAQLIEQKDEVFFNNLNTNLSRFGDCFITKEFEETGKIDTSGVPPGFEMPEVFNFKSKYSQTPPWYKKFFNDLVTSVHYGEFQFCDLPLCVIYVTTVGSNVVSSESIQQMLPLPTWMLEFCTKIPVVNIFVYDSIENEKVPPSFTKGDFQLAIPIGIKTKDADKKAKINNASFKLLFQQNPEIIENMLKTNWLSKDVVERVRDAIRRIKNEVVDPSIKKDIRKLNRVIEKSKKMKNVIKGLFKKGESDQRTAFLSIPMKKIVYLRIASLYMITCNYVEAEKNFKIFASMIKKPQLSRIKLEAIFFGLVCNIINTSNNIYMGEYRELKELLPHMKSYRMILSIPLILAEFNINTKNYATATDLIFQALDVIKYALSGNVVMKAEVFAILFDRIAGITQHPNHALYYYAIAGEEYSVVKQYGHALRCIFWVIDNVSSTSWPLLYQGVILRASINLSFVKESLRAFKKCKDLLEMDNLQKELQEQVISQFWNPFNDSNFDISKSGSQLLTLLTVDGTSTIGPSDPQYWGFDSKEFSGILEEYNKVVKRDEIKNSKGALSFECWMGGETKKEEKPIKVSTGQSIRILLDINNRYTFTVFLKSATISAEYSGKSTKGEKYTTNTISDVCVRGRCQIPFEFTPTEPGIYTINKFNKNYWGYLETDVKMPPVKIEVSDKFPKLSISVNGLPETAFQGMCVRFTVIVKNDSDYPSDDCTVGFDHPYSIAYEGDIQHEENIALIKLEESIPPHGSVSIPLIFRAAIMNANNVHFFVAANNSICGYSEVKVSVSSVGTVSATAIRNTNDTGNTIFKVKFTSNVDGLSIVGISNQKGHILKTLQSNTPSIIEKGSFSTMLAFSQEESNDTLDPWRIFMMGGSSYAILYKVAGCEMIAQQNLRIRNEPEKRFILSMPNKSTEELGTRIKVTIKQTDKDDIFIQPMPLEIASDEKNSNKVLLAARWIGTTRKKMNAENSYETDFYFIALEPGIFVLPGFLYSANIDFSDVHEIQLRHTIHIMPK